MPVLSGSASMAVRPLLEGPPRACTVVSAGSCSVYLRVGADVLAVLTAAAARVPCAVALAPSAALPASLVPGREALVGAGMLAWTDTAPWQLRPRRWWAPAVVRPGASTVGGAVLLRRLLHRAGGAPPQDWLAEAVDSAARSLAAGRPEEAACVCLSLLGLGRGSTPSGDDAVAGLLLAARALLPVDGVGEGHGPARALAALAERVAAAAPDRTTAVSAALLRHAAAGRTVDCVGHAVDVVVDRWPGPRPDEVLRRLLALGHGSGVDTATGLLAAAGHLAVAA